MRSRRSPASAREPDRDGTSRTGLARALSKLGFCSRSQAVKLIEEGRVAHNDLICRDAEAPVNLATDRLSVDGRKIDRAERVYLMLNKPRGIVTSAADEQGRPTVYRELADLDLPWVAPVGRLDKASEGLLLLTNDTAWAARITDPAVGIEKTYHLQIDRQILPATKQQMLAGIPCNGEILAVKRVAVLRSGQRNCWLEIVLDEGRNRHLRRLMQALDLTVLRLVRVAIGDLTLGDLAKGAVRALTDTDLKLLGVQPRRQQQ